MRSGPPPPTRTPLLTISLTFLSQHQIIILDSTEAARELLDAQSQNTSNRVQSVLISMCVVLLKLVSPYAHGTPSLLRLQCHDYFSLMNYSTEWRIRRRLFHQHYGQPNALRYRSVHLRQVRAFLTWIQRSPKDIRKHLQQ